ncbi:hypothetical protein FOCC_FOCC007486, partial [Frankliniella occidentalis]
MQCSAVKFLLEGVVHADHAQPSPLRSAPLPSPARGDRVRVCLGVIGSVDPVDVTGGAWRGAVDVHSLLQALSNRARKAKAARKPNASDCRTDTDEDEDDMKDNDRSFDIEDCHVIPNDKSTEFILATVGDAKGQRRGSGSDKMI